MTKQKVREAHAAPKAERPRTKKVLASLAAVTMVGVAGVAGTTAALSATTENAANEFDAAYLSLEDNDAESFMYDVENQEPTDFVERCIQISYDGSKDAALELYLSSGALLAGAANLNLTVESGTQPAASVLFRKALENNDVDPNDTCTGFTATGGPLFTGKLNAFQTAHNSEANGLVDPTPLTPGTDVVYRIKVELDSAAEVTALNYLSGKHTYTWRAEQVDGPAPAPAP